VIALLAWAGFAYNRPVRLRNQVATAWAAIDVPLPRRHDLVPRLVAALTGYASPERALPGSATERRSRAWSPRRPRDPGALESELEQGLGRLLALREAYPDLKANANFAQLQRDLVEVEEHLQYARRFYNGAVRDLNDTVQRVPDLLVARTLGFGEAEFFQADAAHRAAPVVEMQS